jgi:TP901 family phage tail tape measure protein
MAKLTLRVDAENKAAQEKIASVRAEINKLKQSLAGISTNVNLNALKKQFASLYSDISKLNAKKPSKAYSDLQNGAKKYLDEITRLATTQKRNGKLTDDEIKRYVELKQRYAELSASQKAVKATTTDYTQAQDKATQSTQKQTTATKQNTEVNKEHRQSILSMTRGILEWQIATTLVMKPLRALQDALASINDTLVETEDRVIELQRVVGNVANANELYDLAAKYGQTFENVSEATLNFARRGMSWNESLKATEAALLAINVAELDVGQATDGLGAIMAQFGLKADELTNVVDKLNKTADNFPVTTEKILAALQRTGSTASTANLSLEETIGLITTLSKATNRSGENIGTALNSILNIAQKDSTLDTFSKLGDSVASVVEQYRGGGTSILEVLRAVSEQVEKLDTNQILDSEAFNLLNEDLKESMGEDFEMLSEIYGTAGTYRRNYFVALMKDLDTVKQVEKEIADAQGYSQKENDEYMKTYTARVNKLNAEWKKLANDQQGILGLKKSLVEIGGGILTIINHTGKLTTVFLLAGAAVNKLVGAKLADSLAKQITSWSSLSRVVNAQAKPAIINYTAEIRRLKAEILTTVDSEALLQKQTELLSMKQQRLATAFKGLSTAINAALIVFAAVNAIQGAIDQAEEDRIAKEQEELRLQNEAIAKSVESIDENKKLAQSTKEYADTVEKLRETLDSTTASESEKQSAQSQLLAIQNNLIESNNSYAGSLDLINGKLVEQLELVEKMSDEQLKQQAKKFLDDNYAQIADADKIVNDNKSTSVELLYGTAFDNEKNKDFIRNLIAKAQEQGIDLGLDNYVNAPNWNPVINIEEAIRDGVNGKGWDIWQLLGFNYKKEQWTGESSTGITAEGTLEERLKALQDFRKLVVDNYADLGMSEADSVAYVKLLDAAIAELNSTENQNAILLDKKAKASQQYFNGEISRAEYLKIVYGIEEDITTESDKWTNNIQDVKGKYDDLISKLEELRDLQKEGAELEEKKADYIEAQNELIKAQQALENAKNEATVRRFNQATGQWEWQVDEKKVSEAEETVKKQEESVEKAREELEKQAYDTIIKQLQDKTATNDGLNDLLKGLKDYLGDEFINGIKEAIKTDTEVDLDLPINTLASADTDTGTENSDIDPEVEETLIAIYKKFNEEFTKGLKSVNLTGNWGKKNSYDSGGVANGLGVMVKATAKPESVNDPELTRKILSPVSNAEFNRYVRDMGIMFERSHQYAQAPIIERVGGAVDNRVNNSGQVFIQGVNVGTEKRDGILDALALAPLMNDN